MAPEGATEGRRSMSAKTTHRAPWAAAAFAGLLYFALAFGAGFVLGACRVLFVAPVIGERAAELLELPIMLVVVVAAARWLSRRLAVPAASRYRLAMGGIALALMLVAEFGLVLRLRGMSVADYLANRDSVSGGAYYAMLVVFAALPLWLARR